MSNNHSHLQGFESQLVVERRRHITVPRIEKLNVRERKGRRDQQVHDSYTVCMDQETQNLNTQFCANPPSSRRGNVAWVSMNSHPFGHSGATMNHHRAHQKETKDSR